MKSPYLPHLENRSRLRIAISYAQQEMRKLLPLIRSAALWKSIDKQIARWPKELSIRNFWNAVHGISMGFRQKSLVPWITSLNVKWRLESVPLDELWFGGKFINGFERVVLLKRALSRDKRLFQLIKKTAAVYSKNTAPRDQFPIFVVRKEGKLRVIDGNRRVVRALVKHRTTIRAFVGKPVAAPVMFEHWLPTQLLTDLDFWHKRQRELGRKTTAVTAKTIAELIRDSSAARWEFFHKVIRKNDPVRGRLLRAVTSDLARLRRSN